LVIGTAAKAGIRFLTYEEIKKLLADENGHVSGPRSMIGMCVCVCVSDSERERERER